MPPSVHVFQHYVAQLVWFLVMTVTTVKVLITLVFNFCYAACEAYTVPDAKLEVQRPKGFYISIPDSSGIEFVAFHARRNTPLEDGELGEFTSEVTMPKDGYWAYSNSDVALEKGDTIYYWIYVQHESFGYKKSGELHAMLPDIDVKGPMCDNSKTSLDSNYMFCSNDVILYEEFNQSSIDTSKWIIDHFIPTGKDYEFVSYQNNPAVVFVKEGKLFIKPKAQTSDESVRGTLDLREGCTARTERECFFQHRFAQILPPVISGRMRFKHKLKYGKIEIRAKLPQGDWIYPQLRLISSDTDHAIWIAYARGNKELTGDDGTDLGSSILFGGVVENIEEPGRSRLLRSLRDKSFTEKMHTYTLIWELTQFRFLIDGNQFGQVKKNELQNSSSFEKEYQVVLGVGVGGNNDFPNDYRSGNYYKPWRNMATKMVYNFFKERNSWLPTWEGDDAALQIDYIKITAL